GCSSNGNLPGDTMTSTDSKKYCHEVLNGKMPIQFIAMCMNQALYTYTLPSLCSKSVYWMLDEE
ncbi:hypothetical protein SK128_003367, partial [Halocaridina rubra]